MIGALERVWSELDKQAIERGWSPQLLAKQKTDNASRYFRGIDKDAFLAKVTKAYMALVGDGRGGVFCENSLRPINQWDPVANSKVQIGQFDIVVTNPPFGSKIKVRGDEILAQYELGKKWSKKAGAWSMQDSIRDQQAPQVLFLERCLQLLRPGGRLGIVLPESTFGNPSHGYVVEYLLQNTKILGLVSMPEELFQPYTHAKTCVLLAEKVPNQQDSDYSMFMGIADWCGQDSRGNAIPHDDVPLIAKRYTQKVGSEEETFQRLGFYHDLSNVIDNILIPKYYDPDIVKELNSLTETHEPVTIKSLMDSRAISVITGTEIGKLSYGTGTIPFIRTSDISNWELKIDPKQGVSEEIYAYYSEKFPVQKCDILIVRDGTYLVGTSCMLTKHDTKMLFQSHIFRVRVLKPDKISPFLFLAIINSPIVKKQIRAKQFTQDIIDTLGKRLNEIVLPIPKDEKARKQATEETKLVIEQRSELKEKARQIALQVAAVTNETSDEGSQ